LNIQINLSGYLVLERKPLVSKRKRQEQGFINKLLFFQSVYETTIDNQVKTPD